MTVTTTATLSGPYATDGVDVSFPFSFAIINSAELRVFLRDADGVDSEANSSLYDVTLAAVGGTVTFSTAPAAGFDLYIESYPSFLQEVDFQQGGAFTGSAHNNANDRAALRDLWLRERAVRAIKVPSGEDVADLPVSVDRAGKFLAFDAGGNPIPSSGTGADAGLRDDLALETGSSLVGFVQQGAGAVARTVQSKLRDLISVKDFGATGNGSSDDSAAFIAARTAANGKAIYVPAGTYKLNSVLSSSEDLILQGDGPATILDFIGAVTGGNYAIEATGAATLIEDLSGTQTVGSTSITFVSAPSLSVGDVFVIHNPTSSSWSGFRAEYQAGEWCEVESISGSTVTLKNPLYDTYAGASVDVYKITGPKVILRDFAIRGDTILGLIKTTYCLNPIIENITATHSNDSCIYVDRCMGGAVLNANVKNVGDGGDDYGLSIGNSQHIRVIGGSYYARRHGIMHGGNSGACVVPCRDVRVTSVTVKNDTASGTQAFDYHGNSEDCSVSNSTIYGGIQFGGKNVSAVNCNITSDNGGRCVYHAEIKGGRIGTDSCTFTTYVDPDGNSRGIYDIGGNNLAITANTTETTTFYARDCRLLGRNLSSSTIFAKFGNNGSTQSMNFEIDGLNADVNAFGAVLRTTLTSGTAASSFVIVNGIVGFPAGTALHTAVGSSYLNFPHRLQRQTGSESISAGTGTNSTSGTLATFKYAYPRTPQAAAGGLAPFNNNVTANPGLNFLSSTQIRPYVFSADGTNWNATTSVTVGWSAEISEV